MTDNQNLASEIDQEYKGEEAIQDSEEMRLDDARRVKVLSPGMLVFKRFIRNKLAVIGLVIIVLMFIFAFVGPFLSPYEQTQVFTGMGSMSKDFAGAIYNNELRFTTADGQDFSSAARAQFLLALSKGEVVFSYNDADYYYLPEGENTYQIVRLEPVAVDLLGRLNPVDNFVISDAFTTEYESAIEEDRNEFTLDGVTYRITEDRKTTNISTEQEIALATLNIYDAYNEADVDKVNSYDFELASERAIAEEKSTFSYDGQTYSIHVGEGQSTITDSNGKDFAEISTIIVNPLDQSQFIPVTFKTAVREAIIDNESTFSYIEDGGEEVTYAIDLVNANYYIKKETPTVLIRQYELPSFKHPLGLDNNGMDVMTRLMFGGRVSLMVGFVVVFFETGIGVVIGGISGYFGGWIDTSLMRFVDLVNSIPFYPVVIILGSVMDTLEVSPLGRIFLLMAVLGILGWTGVARVVRGQILSLREQDFMVATEATGIRTSRRIFTHLVPNVMPLLIVQATAGLGGVIIAEATLGFLGLGVKVSPCFMG